MDCYLCGATNAPDVDYCVRCDGQLLRIGSSDDVELAPVDPMAPPPIPPVENGSDQVATDDLAPPPIPAPPIPDFEDNAETTDLWATDSSEGNDDADAQDSVFADMPLVNDGVVETGEFSLSSDFASPDIEGGGLDHVEDVLGHANDEFADAAEDRGDTDESDDEGEHQSAHRVGSLKQVEHQRLQEALGLGDDTSTLDIGEISVTAVPTAQMAAEIPVIGTSQPTVPSEPTSEAPGVGKSVFVVFAALIGLAIWLGLKAFSPSETPPDELAFTNPTTTIAELNTTSVPKPWSASEVEGEFAANFVTVVLHDCFIDTSRSDTTAFFASDPASTDATSGIAVNANNVVIGADVLPQADVATVRTRVGSTIYALIHEHPSGVRIVNFPTRISKHLVLDKDSAGAPAWHVRKDIVTNEITTSEISAPGEMELLSSAYGEPVGIQSGGAVVDAATLADIDHQASLTTGDATKHATTSCDFRNFLIDETPSTSTSLELESSGVTDTSEDSGDSQ